MALRTRNDHYQARTRIVTKRLVPTSRLVANITGIQVQRNKAIVGRNAFAHEAGIHQDGMLKNEETYEIMRPETVGAGQTQLVLGKHSGRHAFANRLGELGSPVSGDGLDKAFARFKKLADKKKHITDADLLAVVSDELHQPKEFWKLEAIQVSCGTGMPTATVKLTGPGGETQTAAEVGTGPVDAVYKAIQLLVHVPCTLLEYTVQSVTEGIDALGEVNVRVSPHDGEAQPDKINPQYEHSRARVFHGHGAHTDVIVASAKAYVAAVNRILAIREATQNDSKTAGSAA